MAKPAGANVAPSNADATAARLRRGDADRAGHAGPAQPAVPVRVLREVLLVVRLGVVERGGLGDLSRDVPVAALGELRLDRLARVLRRTRLLRGGRVDRRAVLRPAVV